jgi:hypothetical protein
MQSEWLELFETVATILGVTVTAIATVFLWRVTRLLAFETKRMAEALSQPHVVAVILPNQWAIIHADFVVENKGTGTAFDVQIAFDPPLENGKHRGEQMPLPLQNISVLKPGQVLRSYLGDFPPIIEKTYRVTVSWKRDPADNSLETLSYTLDMTMFKGITQLGSPDPLVQIASQMRKLREDWQSVSTGFRAIRTDVFTTADRAKEERNLQRRWREQEKKQKAKRPPRGPGGDQGTGGKE